MATHFNTPRGWEMRTMDVRMLSLVVLAQG